jgi:hypothetical protein
MMMLLYWTAHMDFPYIENANNFLIDYHIVYGLVLLQLIVQNAGHVWGLDGWLAQRGASIPSAGDALICFIGDRWRSTAFTGRRGPR